MDPSTIQHSRRQLDGHAETKSLRRSELHHSIFIATCTTSLHAPSLYSFVSFSRYSRLVPSVLAVLNPRVMSVFVDYVSPRFGVAELRRTFAHEYLWYLPGHSTKILTATRKFKLYVETQLVRQYLDSRQSIKPLVLGIEL